MPGTGLGPRGEELNMTDAVLPGEAHGQWEGEALACKAQAETARGLSQRPLCIWSRLAQPCCLPCHSGLVGRGWMTTEESAYNAGDPDSIPGSGGSAGEGIDYLLQYSWASLVVQLVPGPPSALSHGQRGLPGAPPSGSAPACL